MVGSRFRAARSTILLLWLKNMGWVRTISARADALLIEEIEIELFVERGVDRVGVFTRRSV
jgi:hypothetical protein